MGEKIVVAAPYPRDRGAEPFEELQVAQGAFRHSRIRDEDPAVVELAAVRGDFLFAEFAQHLRHPLQFRVAPHHDHQIARLETNLRPGQKIDAAPFDAAEDHIPLLLSDELRDRLPRRLRPGHPDGHRA